MPRSQAKIITLVAIVLSIGSPRAFPAIDSPVPGPHIVMVIRHGEKPEAGDDGQKDPDLSPRGYQRAEALAKVIPDHFPRPDFLIATMKSKGSNRPAETITPLAQALHEPIEMTFKDAEFDQLAHAVLTDPKYSGKTVLIAWHHGKIPELAKALGIKDAPDKWDPNVFDRVWEITFKDNVPTWKDLPENALPGDSQK